MLVAERYDEIARLVSERGSIRVTELSGLFGVAEETIRRDLDALEGRGLLRRSHGGAVRNNDQLEAPYFERKTVNIEEKREIAATALQFVLAGDQIILDASTTAWYMASSMPNIRLTVLTNSIKVAAELASKDKVTVISTGGVLSPRSLSFVGPSAERALDLHHVNKAFLSCKGLHMQKGITESNELQASVKRKMIEISDERYLLIDYSKFDLQEFIFVSDLEQIQHVITDFRTAPDKIARLQRSSVHVVQVEMNVERKREAGVIGHPVCQSVGARDL